VGTVAGSFIIVMVEAGIVATGLQGFWVRAVVGVVFLAAVVGHLVIQGPQQGQQGKTRRRLLHGKFGLNKGGEP
jgi:simple sugar transport system permease protein